MIRVRKKVCLRRPLLFADFHLPPFYTDVYVDGLRAATGNSVEKPKKRKRNITYLEGKNKYLRVELF